MVKLNVFLNFEKDKVIDLIINNKIKKKQMYVK